MDVVTRLIQRKGWWFTDNGHHTRVENVFFKGIPTEPYQVIYALSGTGEYEVTDFGYSYGWCKVNGMANCFLPFEWVGKRVNRYVVPLSAAKRAK